MEMDPLPVTLTSPATQHRVGGTHNLKVRVRALSKYGLSDHAGEGEHGKAAVCDLLQLHVGSLFQVFNLQGNRGKVEWIF